MLTYKKHGTNMASNENPKRLPYLPHGVPFKKLQMEIIEQKMVLMLCGNMA
jgi:hypothetical protein